MMGNSLHNKIYLGRRAPVVHGAGVALLAVAGAFALVGLAWLLIYSLK